MGATDAALGATAPGLATFRAIGTTNSVLATAPEVIDEAREIARRHLRELDAAVSRFRPDSEVSLLAARALNGSAGAFVSPIFADYLSAALRVARLTGGLVDPTVGSVLSASGYDADLDVVRARAGFSQTTTGVLPRWNTVKLDVSRRRVSLAAGTLLDLGASAKAHAADRIAGLLAERLPGGFVVNLGGDIAVSGELPTGGWAIGVDGADGTTRQVVTSTGQALATSSTRLRTWQTDDGPRHHIIDPRTGRSAQTVWAQATCVGITALEANAASTSAIVLGRAAPGWLVEQGIPSRLEAIDGSVVSTPGWPAEAGRAA
ncbi:MAG: FAD:protein FMN transferase [Terracoccus sp.]